MPSYEKSVAKPADEQNPDGAEPRRMRADAQRKMDSLLKAAAEVFRELGADAPVH